jgi:hypothetical protein
MTIGRAAVRPGVASAGRLVNVAGSAPDALRAKAADPREDLASARSAATVNAGPTATVRRATMSSVHLVTARRAVTGVRLGIVLPGMVGGVRLVAGRLVVARAGHSVTERRAARAIVPLIGAGETASGARM